MASSTQHLDIHGEQIFVRTLGKGPALVILHGGLGLDQGYLHPHFDALAEDYQLIFPDLLGCGQSSSPQDFSELTLDRLADDIEAMRSQLGLDSFYLLGHSYGGFVAQTYAARYPKHLSAAIFASTVPAFDYAPTLSGSEAQMAAFGAMIGRPQVSNEEFRRHWTTAVPMYFADPSEAQLSALDSATRYNYLSWNAAAALLPSFDVREALQQLEMPVLTIGGADDGITPPEPGTERIAALCPQGRAVVLENTGHFPFIESPAAFQRAIRGFLDSLG